MGKPDLNQPLCCFDDRIGTETISIDKFSRFSTVRNFPNSEVYGLETASADKALKTASPDSAMGIMILNG